MLQTTVNNAPIRITFKHEQHEGTWKTTCKMYGTVEDPFATGVAVKSSKDFFNKNTGRKVALKKAMRSGGVIKEVRVAIWQAYFKSRHGKY